VERIPAWIKWATQEWNEVQFNGVYYEPPAGAGEPGQLTPDTNYTFKWPRPERCVMLCLLKCLVWLLRRTSILVWLLRRTSIPCSPWFAGLNHRLAMLPTILRMLRVHCAPRTPGCQSALELQGLLCLET